MLSEARRTSERCKSVAALLPPYHHPPTSSGIQSIFVGMEGYSVKQEERGEQGNNVYGSRKEERKRALDEGEVKERGRRGRVQ